MSRLRWYYDRVNRVLDCPLLARRVSGALLILGAAYVASHIAASTVGK